MECISSKLLRLLLAFCLIYPSASVQAFSRDANKVTEAQDWKKEHEICILYKTQTQRLAEDVQRLAVELEVSSSALRRVELQLLEERAKAAEDKASLQKALEQTQRALERKKARAHGNVIAVPEAGGLLKPARTNASMLHRDRTNHSAVYVPFVESPATAPSLPPIKSASEAETPTPQQPCEEHTANEHKYHHAGLPWYESTKEIGMISAMVIVAGPINLLAIMLYFGFGSGGGKVLGKPTVRDEFPSWDDDASTKVQLLILTLLLLFIYLGVGVLYGNMYGWTIVDSCYFVVSTLTTIGYGDFGFASGSFDRIFGGCYVLYGVLIVGGSVGVFMEQGQEPPTSAKPESHHFDLWQEKKRVYCRLFKHGAKFIAWIAFGTYVMMHLMDWTSDNAFYWAAITVATVGYGQPGTVPLTDASKVFTSFFMIVSLCVLGDMCSTIAGSPKLLRELEHKDNVIATFGQSMTPEDVQWIMESDDMRLLKSKRPRTGCPVTRAEFAMIVFAKLHHFALADVLGSIDDCLSAFETLSEKLGNVEQPRFSPRADVQNSESPRLNAPQSPRLNAPQLRPTGLEHIRR